MTSTDPPVQTVPPTAALAGRTVYRVGYGAMQLSERGVDVDTGVAVLRRAVELGVDHIDTAEFYGDGHANDLIRRALHPYVDDLALATKVGAVRDGSGALVTAQRPAELRAAVEANLHRLGVDRLAVVNLRRTDVGPGIVAEGEQVVDLDDQLAELASLRDAGKIDGIGLSHVSLAQLRQAQPVGIACVQNLYNLLDRGAEPLLDACRADGIAWVPFFPLGSGFAGRDRVTADPVVIATAGRLGVTPAQVGLAWLLAHAPQVLLIPGTVDPDHLAQNSGAARVALDAEAMTALDALGAA